MDLVTAVHERTRFDHAAGDALLVSRRVALWHMHGS
jgi:hypothetical protein